MKMRHNVVMKGRPYTVRNRELSREVGFVTEQETGVYERLLAIAGGDRSFLSCLVKAFLDDIPGKLVCLREAVAHQLSKEARLELANIKSSGELLGFSFMSELCRQLEVETDSEALLRDLLTEYKRIETELNMILKRAGSAESRDSSANIEAHN